MLQRILTGMLVLLSPFLCVPRARAAEEFQKIVTTYSGGLSYPAGVRFMGMGATGVASVTGPYTGYFNPASLAWADRIGVETSFGSYALYPADADLKDARASWGTSLTSDNATNEWRVGALVGYSTFDLKLDPAQSFFLPDTDYSDSYVTAIGAGRWVRGPFSIGVGGAAKYLDLYFEDLNTWLFDAGTLASWSFRRDGALIRPRAGLSVTNLNGGVNEGGISVKVDGFTRLGAGVDFMSPPKTLANRSVPVFAVSVDYDHVDQRDSDARYWAVGMEVSIFDLFQARVGQEDRDDTDTNTFGFGLGWEFGPWMVRADYARQSYDIPLLANVKKDTYGIAAGLRL